MQLQYQKGPGECGSLGFEAFQGLGKGWEISTQGEHRASGARFLKQFTRVYWHGISTLPGAQHLSSNSFAGF